MDSIVLISLSNDFELSLAISYQQHVSRNSEHFPKHFSIQVLSCAWIRLATWLWGKSISQWTDMAAECQTCDPSIQMMWMPTNSHSVTAWYNTNRRWEMKKMSCIPISIWESAMHTTGGWIENDSAKDDNLTSCQHETEEVQRRLQWVLFPFVLDSLIWT